MAAAIKQIQDTQEALLNRTPLHDSSDMWVIGNGDDKQRATLAQKYRNLAIAAESAGKLDAKLPTYKLVASFEYDQSKVFHVDFLRSPDGDESTARQFAEVQRSVELSDESRPSPMNTIPVSDAQVRQQLLAKVDAFFNNVTERQGGGTVSAFGHTGELPFYSGFAIRSDEQREKARQSMVDLILSAYTYREDRVSSPNRSKDWSLTDGWNFVMFFIDQQTYEQQPDFLIKFSVQSATDPNDTLNQRLVRRLTHDHFQPMTVTEAGKQKVIYWTAREMTGNSLPIAALAAQLQQRKQALEVIKSELTKNR